jgi:hypothetical protein
MNSAIAPTLRWSCPAGLTEAGAVKAVIEIDWAKLVGQIARTPGKSTIRRSAP